MKQRIPTKDAAPTKDTSTPFSPRCRYRIINGITGQDCCGVLVASYWGGGGWGGRDLDRHGRARVLFSEMLAFYIEIFSVFLSVIVGQNDRSKILKC
jgi:hypothetical protein